MSAIISTIVFGIVMLYQVRPLIEYLINGAPRDKIHGQEDSDWLGSMMATMLFTSIYLLVASFNQKRKVVKND